MRKYKSALCIVLSVALGWAALIVVIIFIKDAYAGNQANSYSVAQIEAYDVCPGHLAYMRKQQYDGQLLELAVCVRYFEYGNNTIIIDGYSASGIFHNGFDKWP